MNLPTIRDPDTLNLLRAMWGDLHTYAATYPENPTSKHAEAADQWLESWRMQFPQGCPCKQGWEDAGDLCPPPLQEGGVEFFEWTLAVHDRVNTHLGKPLFWAGSEKHPLLAV